ncbi:LOW QUALITY PROTEIN: hypothetical protein ACHAWF_013979 [Thalassiosira exigua]
MPPHRCDDLEHGVRRPPSCAGARSGSYLIGKTAGACMLLTLAIGGREHRGGWPAASNETGSRVEGARRTLRGWGKRAPRPSHDPPKPGREHGEPVAVAPQDRAPVAPKAEGLTPSTHLPEPTDECKDDAKFVNSKLKTCAGFVAHVGRVPLHQARCAQGTGIFDNKGEELLVKHFCRESCGLCGDGEWVQMERQKNEYADQLEGEADEEANMEKEAKEFEEAVQEEESEMTTEEMEMIEENVMDGMTIDAGISGEVEEEAALQELHNEEVEEDECADDGTFLYEGKTCANYVEGISRSSMLTERCGEGLGQLLSLGNFCPRSCGLCEERMGVQKVEALVAKALPAKPAVGSHAKKSPPAKAPIEEKQVRQFDPVAEAPVAKGPVTEVLAAEAPVPAKPVVETPTKESAVAEELGAAKPEAKAPVAEAQMAHATPTEEKSVQHPEPAAETPVVESPAEDTLVAVELPEVKPAPKAPVTKAPAATAACVDNPTFVFANGKTCATLGAMAQFPVALHSLCAHRVG